MKFSQILEKGSDAILIEEWCNDRLVGCHTSHGFGADVNTENEDQPNYYFLYYSGKGEGETKIKIEQEVEITALGDVSVKDEEGNRIELRFFSGSPMVF